MRHIVGDPLDATLTAVTAGAAAWLATAGAWASIAWSEVWSLVVTALVPLAIQLLRILRDKARTRLEEAHNAALKDLAEARAETKRLKAALADASGESPVARSSRV